MKKKRGLGFPRESLAMKIMKFPLGIALLAWISLASAGAWLVCGITPRSWIPQWANDVAVFAFYAGICALIIIAVCAAIYRLRPKAK
ncbi:TPA: hypothetical protein L4R50_000344 [Pseudomonas aeruginosa]|nr:hypothetical protein [Pseudomonas aeruginosa]